MNHSIQVNLQWLSVSWGPQRTLTKFKKIYLFWKMWVFIDIFKNWPCKIGYTIGVWLIKMRTVKPSSYSITKLHIFIFDFSRLPVVHRCHPQDRPGITPKLISPMKWCVREFGSTGTNNVFKWENLLSCSGSQKQVKPQQFTFLRGSIPMAGHPLTHIEKIATWRHGQNPLSLVFQPYDPMVTNTLYILLNSNR